MVRGIRWLLWVAMAVAFTSCTTIRDLWRVRGVEKYEARFAVVGGTVGEESGATDHWLVVWIAKVPCDEDWSLLLEWSEAGRIARDPAQWDPEISELSRRILPKMSVVQHVLVQGSGRWFADLPKGCYGVGAFADHDGDYAYDDDEPAALASTHSERLFRIEEEERRGGIHIVIPQDGRLELNPLGRQVRSLEVRSYEDQLLTSADAISVEGEVVDLADARFGAESGRMGYWQPVEFAWQLRTGVYFLEAYDPEKVPVLFVHGAQGYPQEFTHLIEGLDRERFQPWFYFYPSGVYLDGCSEYLAQAMMRLQHRFGFDEMAVVAHSMGGLVARSFVLKYHDRVREDPVRLFVSIATPWNGMQSARSGVESSPVVVPSWRDVAVGSGFLEALFFDGEPTAEAGAAPRRKIPDSVRYDLIFATRDATIGLDTAIRWEALRDAGDRWPLPYDHVSILHAPETSLLLNESLSELRGP